MILMICGTYKRDIKISTFYIVDLGRKVIWRIKHVDTHRITTRTLNLARCNVLLLGINLREKKTFPSKGAEQLTLIRDEISL